MLRESRLGHLATATKTGMPHVIPICYYFGGRSIYSPIDLKRKNVEPERLQRVRDIRNNPRVCMVVDLYSENWKELCHVLVHGQAKILHAGPEHRRAVASLRRKYPQYRRMRIENRPIIRINPNRIVGWHSTA